MLAVLSPQHGAVRHRTGSDQGIRQFHRAGPPVLVRVKPCPASRFFIDRSTRQRQKQTALPLV
jgi:hypothetical protein